MAAARDVRTARGRVRRRGCTRVARFIGLLMLSARSHGQTVGDNLREIQRLAEHARAPLVTSGMAMPAFELRSVFEPFTNRFTAPAVKMTRGGDGAPVNRSDLAPQSVEQAIETVTRPHEPRSLVLRLEELAADALDGAPLFQELLAPFLPLSNGTTAHVYLSSSGASALANHTDVTEILVVQLLGRKEWLYCPEKTNSLPFVSADVLAAKLPKCSTYSEEEMATLDCERVITSPGDVLYLPRRTVHSARAVEGFSVHLTIGYKSPGMTTSRRRLESCATGCDATCTSQCDGSGCDESGCDEASCDGSGCDGAGCDGAGCDGAGCDVAGCDGSGCDGSGSSPSP